LITEDKFGDSILHNINVFLPY